MFVNFAKEQTDEDCLTEVVVGNRIVQPNQTAVATRIDPPAIEPQPPITPPQQTSQQHGKSSDSKDGQSKKAKASKGKLKEGKVTGEKSNSMEMTKIRRGSSGSSSSSSGEVQGESSRFRESKHLVESSGKDPSALFMVSNTQDSTL